MSSCLLRVRQEDRCALFVKTLSRIIEDMILIDTIKKHQAEVEEKLKLALGSELRKEYVIKKKDEIKRRQNIFVKRSCESLAMTEAS